MSAEGLEPSTNGLKGHCSTIELRTQTRSILTRGHGGVNLWCTINRNMTAIPLSSPNPSALRPLDVRRDLLAVADLIELAFSEHMDADGRDYVRYIRRVANNKSLIRWIPGAAERVSMPLHGYVWEEDGKVVGNLTLIPFLYRGRWIYLIANVAVHPDYRQRGIGRILTQRALEHIREHLVSEAWLQVRDDNPVAIHLYETLGFKERIRRSTWQIEPASDAPLPLPDPRVQIEPRRRADWPQQMHWLSATYPPEVSWNLSFDWRRLRPGLWRSVEAWLNGENFTHWTARLDGRLIGAATWEAGRALSDTLWLGVDPDQEERAVAALLSYGRIRGFSRRFLMVNYPAYRGDLAFEAAGFTRCNTLIWMSVDMHAKG